MLLLASSGLKKPSSLKIQFYKQLVFSVDCCFLVIWGKKLMADIFNFQTQLLHI